ncbi:MAG TPA: polysaccharide deacetylase family protein [Thermoanaerobaculia bacterium]|nr:polysaccharide deacetylase family protein [Thermoanaerobaculia bacterium]
MTPPLLPTPVLMLHHVEPGPLVPPPLHPDSYLGRAEFARFLDDLAARGYRTWTLADAAARAAISQPLPRRSIVLTFDDGCRCFAEHALPELASRGMTATLFAVSGELGGNNRWDRARETEREERLLDAEELRRLAASGIEIGSHSRTHRDLTGCSAEELTAEVAGSRQDLETALGRPVHTFCYPYGRLDGRARAAAVAAGYIAAVGIHANPGARSGDLFALPRMIIHPGESRFERRLKANGLYPLYSRLPRLGLLRALRRGPRKAGAA